MKRLSNIELLRILLMLMIITHHVIVHGFGLKHIADASYPVNKFTYLELAINSFVVIAVNTFIFISGYFGLKFKLRTILSFLTQALFYSVTLYLLFAWFNPSERSIINLLKSFFPISRNVWWFITAYFGLYFMAPFLNKGIEELEQKQARLLLFGLIGLNCFSGFLFGTLSENGYTIFSFIVIYLTARYMATYKIEIKHPKRLLSASTLLLFCFILGFLNINMSQKVWKLFSYNNPLLIISSIMLFFIFKHKKTKQNGLINSLAATTLGIYMIHDYIPARDLLANIVTHLKTNTATNGYFLAPSILLLIISVYISGAIIEMTRQKIDNRLIGKITYEWENNVSVNKLKTFVIKQYSSRHHF